MNLNIHHNEKPRNKIFLSLSNVKVRDRLNLYFIQPNSRRYNQIRIMLIFMTTRIFNLILVHPQ